jgi:hypothetical protein
MTARDTAGAVVKSPVPVHLWIVGILSLLWNAFGAFDYLATQLELDFYMSAFTEEQLAYFYSFPSWSVAAWAFGVWGAVAGSIGLLLRKGWAVWAFAISLAGMAVNSIYTMFLSDGMDLMGEAAPIITSVIWVVAIALLIYGVAMKKRGVLT